MSRRIPSLQQYGQCKETVIIGSKGQSRQCNFSAAFEGYCMVHWKKHKDDNKKEQKITDETN